jgi:hypothetical protein
MQIGFLFNHDQIHQVAHSLPIAVAMAKNGFSGSIIVATTNDRLAREVIRLAGPWIGRGIEHVHLELTEGSKRINAMIGAVVPASKILIYKDNLDFFRSLDILVVAEKTSLLLKSRYGLRNLFIVHTRHGAGDRKIGFNKASADFDHILCSGPKIRRRLIIDAGISPDRISVVGYPKFDLIDGGEENRQQNEKPVALYNPHVSPHLSSWYRHGSAVLDAFLEQEDRSLIFAPHVMLFERAFVLTIDKLALNRARLPHKRHMRGADIRIDLGSVASTNMTYTQAADIYIGDVSSQVYEFIRTPRPCIFLNSHRFDWENDPNFAHWRAGEVLTSPDQLPEAMDRASDRHDRYFRDVQRDLFADSFDIDGRPSADRAAEVISNLAARKVKCFSVSARVAA